MEALERRALAAHGRNRPRRRWRIVLGILGGLVLLALAAALFWLRPESTTPTPREHAELLAVFGGNATPGPPRHTGLVRRSFHLPMRDGVDIAVDLHLPATLKADETVPVVLLPTRYWRRWNLRWPASALRDAPLATRMLVDYGYAVLSIDARGTGASFGVQNYPWSRDEIEDYLEVLDWAVQQPWSNGRAGVSGVSYGGTCAERMAAAGHPALKAAIIQFGLYDVFTDVAYPGGVFNSGFVGRWGRFNQALDNGTLPQFMPWFARAFVLGPAPVDGPQGRQKLALAAREHEANADIYLAAAGAAARDQTAVTERGVAVAMDDFSPHVAWKRPSRAPRPAVYAWGGWFDGAYAASLLRRLCEVDVEQRAVLGPWNHGATQDTDPFAPADAPASPSARVQLLEQIRFFDWYLKDLGEKPAPGLRYRRLGEQAWLQAQGWPPRPMTDLNFRLEHDASLQPGPATLPVAGTGRVLAQSPAPTGAQNRWRTQLGRSDVIYPDMGAQPGQPGRLSWTSAPLEQGLILEGTPLVRTAVAVNATDLSLFAYLEAVSPDGKAHMLSEGLLRALHRSEITPLPAVRCEGVPALHSFTRDAMALLEPETPTVMAVPLLPTAASVPQGWRLRLTLTTCDTGQFTCLPYESNPDVTILPGGTLRLPVPESAEPPK
ncbi:CocE/NonD family hydrolase [Megalodesulfovibrio gigas]|uniref:CocE/NonD family hydrolase n=1 Tax=Megalodesulfovibrio gigas TaxID=879 RepID=UPI000401B533|nr:CocE/NonD family hydrolase [Megalodesulfovibrio gigas]